MKGAILRVFWSWLAVGIVCLTISGASVKGVLYHGDELAQIDAERLSESGFNTFVLGVTNSWEPSQRDRDRLETLMAKGMRIGLWIEVGRDPELADRHPEWMASIQGHPEWRRFYPSFPKVTEQQIVKVYPWVPIAYRDAFDAQLAKVRRVLTRWPKVDLVFLNDIQGAPSACGCGHPLCRWTTDYGPKKTATRLGDDFAAQFVSSVKEIRSGIEVIPVWATECEEGDKPGLCAEVGCYNGACWREWSAQLDPLAEVSSMIGALLLETTFQRSDIGQDWLGTIAKSFVDMPKRYNREGVKPEKLVAVVEGWQPGGQAKWALQRKQLEASGVSSYLVARSRINQEWKPMLVELP